MPLPTKRSVLEVLTKARLIEIARGFEVGVPQPGPKTEFVDALAVQEMIKIRPEMERDEARAKALGLGDDELAFYDAVSENCESVYEQPFLRDLVHEVVQIIKKNLKVDWTEPHRDDVRAAIRAAVKRALRRKNVKADDFEPLIERFMAQAEALWKDWPLAA